MKRTIVRILIMMGVLIVTTGVSTDPAEIDIVENETVSAMHEVLPSGESGEIVTEEENKVEVEVRTIEEPTTTTTTTTKPKTTTKGTTKKSNPTSSKVQTISKEVTTFIGKVTHYGPDCKGCSGRTASGYNVKNTIYYSDPEFGSVRIVAAPKEVPLYSILTLHNYKGNPITVIVLDRGGAIKGTKFDILVSSEKEAYAWGIQNNVEFEILRWGK